VRNNAWRSPGRFFGSEFLTQDTRVSSPVLPASVRVIVRDWLSANNIVLLQPGGNVLVDTSYVSRADETLQRLRDPQFLGDQPLHLIANTHCHSDHMGGNAMLARIYGAPIAVPAGEAPLVRRWDTRGLWLDYADQRSERFEVAEELQPGTLYSWGGLSWEAIASPGHDMGALVFYCAAERLLISGDALWENGFGIVMPHEAGALSATRSTLETLAKLDVRVVIPGHGQPFSDFAGAMERALSRLHAFEADPLRMARNVLKVMLTFSVMARGRLPRSTLAAYLDDIPIYREYNALYFNVSSGALADLLVEALARTGALRVSGAFLVPGNATG
jgi:glyoxylase-like metal-dependent hydrolase (beta-lactamase superfamily II)